MTGTACKDDTSCLSRLARQGSKSLTGGSLQDPPLHWDRGRVCCDPRES